MTPEWSFSVEYCGYSNAINHQFLMVGIPPIKMVMNGEWFMTLLYQHYQRVKFCNLQDSKLTSHLREDSQALCAELGDEHL